MKKRIEWLVMLAILLGGQLLAAPAFAASLSETRLRLDKFFGGRFYNIGGMGFGADISKVEARAAEFATALETAGVDAEIIASLEHIFILPANKKASDIFGKTTPEAYFLIEENATLQEIIVTLRELERGQKKKFSDHGDVANTIYRLPELRSMLQAYAFARGAGAIKIDTIEYTRIGRRESPDSQMIRGSLTGSMIVNGQLNDLKLRFGPLEITDHQMFEPGPFEMQLGVRVDGK